MTNIKKVVITSGFYQERQYKVLVSFDNEDKPIDLIELDASLIGKTFLATVEKVLLDIGACIVNFEGRYKGFVEIKSLEQDKFVKYQTSKNKVSIGDKFWIRVTKDRKLNKPYTCSFVSSPEEPKSVALSNACNYIHKLENAFEIISDLPEICQNIVGCREYSNLDISLWALYGFTSIIDDAMSKRVYLSDDSNIVIESVEAGTLIDVNSANSKNKADAFNINKLATKEIARQLRLRNISGIIIVDFLKMDSDNERKLLIEEFKLYAIDDIVECQIYEFTRLGLLEITRQRKMSPIYEIFGK